MDRIGTSRTAGVSWRGGLLRGTGELDLPSGVAPQARVSWPSRLNPPADMTSPEELIAAAHAGCFSMALTQAIERHGRRPEQLMVEATCSLDYPPPDDGEPGPVITSIELEVVARVPGLDEADFREATEAAEAACPVSNVLRHGLAISVTARLESA